MLDELRTIFLFEADQVLISSGWRRRRPSSDSRPETRARTSTSPPSKLDLLLFADITASLERAYEFAFNRSRLNTFGEHEVQDLQVFMEGTARIGGISSAGEQHRFMTPDGYCRTVADAALARWKREWAGDYSATFTTRETAADNLHEDHDQRRRQCRHRSWPR